MINKNNEGFFSKVKKIFCMGDKSPIDRNAGNVLQQSKRVSVKKERTNRQMEHLDKGLAKVDKAIAGLDEAVDTKRANTETQLADMNARFQRLGRSLSQPQTP